MGIVTVGHERAWTASAPVPGMTYLTPGPEETTPAPEGDHGAQMMRTAVEEEEEEVEEEEEEEAMRINLPSTLNTNLGRNQGLGGMNATL